MQQFIDSRCSATLHSLHTRDFALLLNFFTKYDSLGLRLVTESLKMLSTTHSRANFIEKLQQPAPQVLAQLAPFTVVCINLEITKNCCGLLKLVHMILIYIHCRSITSLVGEPVGGSIYPPAQLTPFSPK